MEQIFRDPNAFSLFFPSLLEFFMFSRWRSEPLRERRRNDFYRRRAYKGTIRFLCVLYRRRVDGGL